MSTEIIPRTVSGYCPMGCGQTLALSNEGFVVCVGADCPHATAPTVILSEAEPEHLVMFGRDSCTVRHPLRERIADQMMVCQLLTFCGESGPPGPPGMYRATRAGDGWSFEAVSR